MRPFSLLSTSLYLEGAIMLYCCDKCPRYYDCVRKWILAQKNLPQTCCAECHEFSKCLEINRLNRWKIIHGDDFVDTSEVESREKESETGSK